MKRYFITAASLLLTAGGLVLFFLGLRSFLAAAEGIMVSPNEVGLYAPPALWLGAVTAALGIILFTFRKHI